MTIKKHNVIKKLDQYTCINPITINGEVITANINGSISFSALKEIQDSLPGWEVCFTNKNGGAALLIRQKQPQTDHMVDAMAVRSYYFGISRGWPVRIHSERIYSAVPNRGF